MNSSNANAQKTVRKGRWSRRILLVLAIVIEVIFIVGIGAFYLQANMLFRFTLNTHTLEKRFEQEEKIRSSDTDIYYVLKYMGTGC